MRYLTYYFVTLAAFVAIDLVWLTQMSARLYRPVLGDILLDAPRFPAAVAFYVTYCGGITIFAGVPALRENRLSVATLYGALFGFFCYATYDLTNQATLRNWSTGITIADIVWGTLLTGTAANIGYILAKAIQSK